MNGKDFALIVITAVIVSVTVTVILKLLNVEGAALIGGGAAGGVTGAVVGAIASKRLAKPSPK